MPEIWSRCMHGQPLSSKSPGLGRGRIDSRSAACWPVMASGKALVFEMPAACSRSMKTSSRSKVAAKMPSVATAALGIEILRHHIHCCKRWTPPPSPNQPNSSLHDFFAMHSGTWICRRANRRRVHLLSAMWPPR